MNQMEAMQIFTRVAELASFTQAADSIGLPKASISTAVQRLESLLGTRLLHRTTRRVQLTQDGQAFYERCKDVLADMEELRGMFQIGEERLTGRLRVDMPMDAARSVVLPRLPEFLMAHPGIQLELSSTDRRVDLVREGFDCVLRVGTLSESSLIARPLGHYRMSNCASPDYLARYGVPHSLDDLAHHQLIHYVPSLGGKSGGFEYVDPLAGGPQRSLAMAGVLTVNNSDAYIMACETGLGIVQAPEPAMRPLIDSGRLVEILPQYRASPMPVSLLYANRRHLPKRVQVFMSWIAAVMLPYMGGQGDDYSPSPLSPG